MANNNYSLIKEDKTLNLRRFIAYLVLSIMCLLCLLFFYMLFVNATRPHADIQRGFSFIPGDFLASNFASVVNNQDVPIFSGMLNSVIVSSLSALFATYFSALTAYAIHVYDFKLKKFAFNFILLVMTIPTQVSALGFVSLMNDLHLRDTFYPLFLPSIASPIVFFFMKQYMDSALPIEIVEAARMDGSHEFHTFNVIILPIIKPAIAVQIIFTFVSSWNNYFTPNLILDSKNMKTLPILVAQLRGADFLKFDMGEVYMMLAIAILPVMIVYFCLSKFIVAGVTLGSVKG